MWGTAVICNTYWDLFEHYRGKKKAMLGTSSQTQLRTIHQLVLLGKQNIPTLHYTNAMHAGLYQWGGQYCQGELTELSTTCGASLFSTPPSKATIIRSILRYNNGNSSCVPLRTSERHGCQRTCMFWNKSFFSQLVFLQSRQGFKSRWRARNHKNDSCQIQNIRSKHYLRCME